MSTIGAYEAKTHLAELLERVRMGEKITITKHGTPIADLVPSRGQKKNVSEAIKDMIAFGKGRKLGDVTIKQLINEGRRF